MIRAGVSLPLASLHLLCQHQNMRPKSASTGGGHKGVQWVFICVNTILCLCMHVLGILEEDIGHLHQLLSAQVFETKPLTKPETHHVD